MEKENQKLSLEKRIQTRLATFFEDKFYSEEEVLEELDTGDVFYSPQDVLPFLQTALVDNKFIEVELNGITQVYFSRLHDHPPEPETDDDGNIIEQKEKYSPGDYLKKFSHLIALPLEPGMGNYSVRYSERILLRFFTTTYAVELGTFFQELAAIDELPVLRLDYPVIGRLVRGTREYRAKVPEKLDIKLMIIGKRRQKSFTTKLINISVSGFALSITKAQQHMFIVDEQRSMEIIINGMMELRVNVTIRHISKIRGKGGTEYMVGVQADLVTRAIAARLEEIVALVQRAHLRELSDLSRESGIELIK